MGVRMAFVADQMGVRLILKNDGDTSVLDLQPYVKVGASVVRFKGKRRLDPGEAYESEKRFPRALAAAAGYYLRLYVDYSDRTGVQSTGFLVARVDDPSGREPDGLRLFLSPQRLSAGASGAAASLRIENRGPQPRDLRVEAFLPPSCEPPDSLPEGPARLPAVNGELLLTLRFPPFPCKQAGEFPWYLVALPVGDQTAKAAVTGGSLRAGAPRSLLRRFFEDKARVLWAVWGCLILLIGSVAMGIRRA